MGTCAFGAPHARRLAGEEVEETEAMYCACEGHEIREWRYLEPRARLWRNGQFHQVFRLPRLVAHLQPPPR